jgi:hypothetical protein
VDCGTYYNVTLTLLNTDSEVPHHKRAGIAVIDAQALRIWLNSPRGQLTLGATKWIWSKNGLVLSVDGLLPWFPIDSGRVAFLRSEQLRDTTKLVIEATTCRSDTFCEQ